MLAAASGAVLGRLIAADEESKNDFVRMVLYYGIYELCASLCVQISLSSFSSGTYQSVA
jgi:hypothetical protein